MGNNKSKFISLWKLIPFNEINRLHKNARQISLLKASIQQGVENDNETNIQSASEHDVMF